MKKTNPHSLSLLLVSLLSSLAFSCTQDQASSGPPKARSEQVIESMHGVEVPDPYRWLENWKDPEVQAWSDAQNAYARAYLDALPFRESLAQRIDQILSARSNSYYDLTSVGEVLFAMKRQPPLNQPLLVLLSSADDLSSERIILDPNQLDTTGSVSIDWYVPSPNGDMVAVSLSAGGSESGDVHLFETSNGKQFDEVILRVNGGTAGGDLAWLPDSSGFYYTRYPREGERPEEDLSFFQQLWFHQLGTSADSDRYELGSDFPKTAEVRVQVAASGDALVTMQLGDSGQFAHYLKRVKNEWNQLATYEDQVASAFFGFSNDLFLVSRKGAPRGKIQRLNLTSASLGQAETIVEEGPDTIVSDFYHKPTFVVTPNRLFVTYQLGGPSEIRVFDHTGAEQASPETPPVSSIYELERLEGDHILYRVASYVQPAAWIRFDGVKGTSGLTALVNESPVDFSDYEVARSLVASKDGTQIPVNIVQRKGIALNGSHPVLLTGYGGFGINRSPAFVPLRKVWLEQGGIFAQANIRGGGEFGEEWHREGMLTRKQNCFDDFAAVMNWLVETSYTSRELLAIMGGSNGGLLMGAVLTQHPDLPRAVVSTVGIYDILRNELTPNGAFNIPEYGTVKDPDQFRAMLAYSPYHSVRKGVSYPAILFMTGANDPRVDPMHSRKFTAILQALGSGDAPVLLRTSSGTGHGLDTPLSEQIEESVDWYGFLFDQLGVEFKSKK
jgi:prolyl oligopeptidase